MGLSLFGPMLASAMAFSSSTGTSYYPLRLDDPKAVYVTAGSSKGESDDTELLQRAIDSVEEKLGQGIVFVPSGRYRLTKTLCVWPGVRVIGYGPTRPTFFLAPHTAGFQSSERQMVFFAGRRPKDRHVLNFDHPAVDKNNPLSIDFEDDANPGTFYSAMSNIDLEIAEGNPSAVGVRGRYAQHCYLAHMDFRIGTALAGIHDIGNLAEDLRFFGGRHGIIVRTPSPGWQFTLMDAVFEGQSVSSIRTYETGLTLIRPSFSHVPTAIAIEPGHSEQLWMSDARMEHLSGPALTISRAKSLRTQINVENVACLDVPTFASFPESGDKVEGKGLTYRVESMGHGLQFGTQAPDVRTTASIQPLTKMPEPVQSDIAPLPAMETWANLAALGAKGDGETDDTAVLKAAIEKYKTIYLPCGKYRVTETIRLKPDTVLVGLHPFLTQILIKDSTPEFEGVPEKPDAEEGYRPPKQLFAGSPKALLETPAGGTNIVSGIGLDAGGNNRAAVAAKWMAGKNSMMEDVKFLGGHGSVPWQQIYNANHSADPNPNRHWDSQYPSLWVTNGGGGTFKNIWTASTFAQAGMAITNTETEGRVYELSSEHHVRHEIQIRNASNWKICALQTEEEWGEGPICLPLEIENSLNILVANLNMYRVVAMQTPIACAVRTSHCSNVRFRGVHAYSNSKASFDSLLLDASLEIDLRQREFSSLDLQPGVHVGKPNQAPTLEAGAKVVRLAGGFTNISGGAVDSKGAFFFVDARTQRILRWSDRAGERLSLVSDAPLSPTNLFFDQADNLVALSYAGKGTVYSLKPGHEEVTVIKPQLVANRAGMTPVLPVTDWMIDDEIRAGRPFRPPYHFVSPDGAAFLPVGQDFVDGELTWGVKLMNVIRTFGLAKATVGKPFYVMGESECQTFVTNVEADGSLTGGRLFAEQGGEGLAVGPDGNVYIAAGQIYVYDPAGKQLGAIEVPERPIQLMFGGADGKTLYIAARSSLYSVRVR